MRLLILLVLLAGCTVAEPVSEPNSTTLPSATEVSVDVRPGDWDGDGEDDGIVVYPTLLDENGETVKFSGVELSVEISFWETGIDDDFNTVKETLLYEGTGTIDNWEDGNYYLEGDGIQIAWDEIASSEDIFGLMEVTIETANGPVTGSTELAQTKP